MQLARNSLALGEAFLETGTDLQADLSDSDSVEKPEQTEAQKHTQSVKPVRLIQRGGDAERERCPGVVPHTIVIRRCDLERISPGPEVGVDSFAPVTDVLPFSIEAAQCGRSLRRGRGGGCRNSRHGN